MRMQSHANLCGFASLANAFRAIGKAKVTEDKLAEAAKKAATSAETPEQDGAGVRTLQVVASGLGYSLEGIKAGSMALAWPCLRHDLGEGHPALLAVDDGGHWVAAVGRIGSSVLIADPADAEIVRPYTYQELSLRWGPDFYSLVLKKAKRVRKEQA